MANPKDLPRDIGGFIRDLRRNAKISLRQLAQQAGVSNPYLSQIERGLRKPSAEVLQQLASALRVSTPVMYLRAGLLDDKDGPGVLAAIATDEHLTLAQKQSLSQIYETFRRENLRLAEAEAAATGAAETSEADRSADEPKLTVPAEPIVPPKPVVPPKPTPVEPAVAVEVTKVVEETPTSAADAVLEAVAVAETGATPAPNPDVRPEKTARKADRKPAAATAEEEK